MWRKANNSSEKIGILSSELLNFLQFQLSAKDLQWTDQTMLSYMLIIQVC